jgi:hypothetical protein
MSSAFVLTFLLGGDCLKTHYSELADSHYVLLIHLGTDRIENTVLLLLFPIVTVQTCLFVKPFLSNGCCIAVYFAVDA